MDLIALLVVLLIGVWVLYFLAWGAGQFIAGLVEMWRMHSPSGKRERARQKALSQLYQSSYHDDDD